MIININKPISWSSFDVVKKVKSITKYKKVGHGGTLDPFASGVLIIGTNGDTKKLTSIILELLNNRNVMKEISISAKNKSNNFTWEVFHQKLYNSIMKLK